MNRAQKIECFNLFVTALSTGGSLGAVILLARLVGMPKAWAGMALMGLMGLMVLGPFIFRNEKGRDKVAFDERDMLIHKRAASAGYIATYVFFLTFCSGLLNSVGINGQVPGYMLLILLAGGFVVLMLAKALALIIQYGWRNKGEKL